MMLHPRSNQGSHGVKGGSSGNCAEAHSGGKLGGRFGAKGGAKSRGKPKKLLTHVQCLRLYEAYVAYDFLDQDNSIFSK